MRFWGRSLLRSQQPEVLAVTRGSLENYSSGEGKGNKKIRIFTLEKDPTPEAQ
jgi:hypothetical protein